MTFQIREAGVALSMNNLRGFKITIEEVALK